SSAALRDLHSFPTRRSSDLVVVIGGGNVAIDVARSAMREQQQKFMKDITGVVLPNELTSSELDVAMKEFMDVSRQALRMGAREVDRKSTRLNSSHLGISYAV